MTTVEIRTRNMYSSLSKSEKLVADYILNHSEDLFGYPLSVLAERSGTSQVAWVRFCKAIGFNGMKDLKNSMYSEANSSSDTMSVPEQAMFPDIKEYSSLNTMAESVCAASIQAIDSTLKLFDVENLNNIVQKIIKANYIRIFGMGASGLVASDLCSKLMRIGYNATYCPDNHFSLTSASILTSNDVAILISNSGETKEILEANKLARKNQATTIALTRFGKSSLAQDADYVLFNSSPELDKRSGAMSSRIAQLVLVDILFTAIANQDYSNVERPLETTFELFHLPKE